MQSLDSFLYVTDSSSSFHSNKGKIGGAISNHGTSVIIGSNFIFNNASDGGAIANFNSLSLETTSFLSNTAQNGGGINCKGYSLITNSQFEENSASRDGGSIYHSGMKLKVERCRVTNGYAGNSGGAINAFSYERRI